MSELIDDFGHPLPFPAQTRDVEGGGKGRLAGPHCTSAKDAQRGYRGPLYTDPEIQALAEATGGCVADSLEMARFGSSHPATTLLVAGVRFMG